MSFSGKKGWKTKPKPGVRLDPLHPLSRGLVAWWLFNEGAGSVLHDISGNANHGTLTNMDPPTDWVGSLHGGGLDFDGSDDHVDVGTVFDPDTAITIAGWVRPNNVVLDMALVGKRGSGGVENTGFRLNFNTGGANDQLLLTIFGAFDQSSDVGFGLTLGEWSHIAVTYDRTSVIFYLNGNPDGGHAQVGAFTSALRSLYVGAHNNRGVLADEVNGGIDNVRIYNRALSAQEIQQLYHDPYCNLLRVPIRRYWGIAVARIPRPPAAYNQLAIY